MRKHGVDITGRIEQFTGLNETVYMDKNTIIIYVENSNKSSI